MAAVRVLSVRAAESAPLSDGAHPCARPRATPRRCMHEKQESLWTMPSATAPEKIPLGVSRRQGSRTSVRGGGLTLAAQPLEQVGSRSVERIVILQVQLVD